MVTDDEALANEVANEVSDGGVEEFELSTRKTKLYWYEVVMGYEFGVVDSNRRLDEPGFDVCPRIHFRRKQDDCIAVVARGADAEEAIKNASDLRAALRADQVPAELVKQWGHARKSAEDRPGDRVVHLRRRETDRGDWGPLECCNRPYYPDVSDNYQDGRQVLTVDPSRVTCPAFKRDSA